MAKKIIKIKKSLLNEENNYQEGLPDQLNAAKGDVTIDDLWNSLFDKNYISQKEFAKHQLDTAVKDKSIKPIDISKIDKIDIFRADGTPDTIYPSRIAALGREALVDLSRNNMTRTLAKYFPYDIIWTFDPAISTAATDGVRLFFNPIFADKLLGLSAKQFGPQAKAMGDKSGTHILRCFQYVIIHEVYHMIFQHRRRAEIKAETVNGKNHQLANIAMDVEINRALESELLQFKGCTKLIGGMWDERFPVEMWEEIFDAYYSGKVNPQSMPSAGGGSGNPQPGQGKQGQQNQQGQNQNQQNQKGQQNQQGQQGQQNQKGQQNQQGQQGGAPNTQNKSPWYQKGFAQALRDIREGKIAIESFINFNETPSTVDEQAEYDQGYQDAIKAYQEEVRRQKAMQNGNSGEGSDGDSDGDSNGGSNGNSGDNSDSNGDNNGGGNGTGNGDDDSVDGSQLSPVQGGDDSVFGGNDMLDTETAQRIAAEAGQPYNNQDIKAAQNVDKKASDFVKENRAELDKISGDRRNGNACGIAGVLAQIDEMFRPTINWKSMLKTFLNAIGVKGETRTYSRRMLGNTNPDLQAGKYIKYKEKHFYEKNGIAQVFHLIDGSGSMGDFTADTFKQIFGEVFDLGTKAHIQKSAVAYFAAGEISGENVRTWEDGVSKSKIMATLSRHETDNAGGTDMVKSIEEVIELGKPYYQKSRPTTLLIVYTDGDDTQNVNKLPSYVLNNTIWLIINKESYAKDSIERLVEQGVKRSRALFVDINKYR